MSVLCFLLLVLSAQALDEVKVNSLARRPIPANLFGIFFEEINHAGAGGLWAELVSNRGFEAAPSKIDPWSIIGDQSSIFVATELSSCFNKNRNALRIDVLCDKCPFGGVGVYNPGFWGMNIEQGKSYDLVIHMRSAEFVNLTALLTCSNGLSNDTAVVISSRHLTYTDLSNWERIKVELFAHQTCRTGRLELRSSNRGRLWLDQVSLMPSETYMGHGFRKDLMSMLLDLQPRFLRFPGGCFVEGNILQNRFMWKNTIGPWEQRPGHYGDVWNYWTDDGLGYFEFLQLAEDLGAAPVWVVNIGISHTDEVNITDIAPLVADVLDSLEFARGSSESKWGTIRSAMGHPEPFPVKYVALGNEDCVKNSYRGHYLRFHSAIRKAYPDIEIISNCDGSAKPLYDPADFYDYHIYENATVVFLSKNKFDNAPRTGPKVFVSEYAVRDARDGLNGSLLASLAEAAFLIGLEKNSDLVQMASYAPLFVNDNDRNWMPDAIVFNSWQRYGTPSYWMQTFFRESSGAVIHPIEFSSIYSQQLAASAITWHGRKNNFMRVKIVNFGSNAVNLTISVTGLQVGINRARSTVTVLTSRNFLDENSFSHPNKVVPVRGKLLTAAKEMHVRLAPYSFTSYDLALDHRT
ncbi:alpha-L-arabinofuranosidase 1 isoform X2 [Lolium perenne]|nr:alpha-L-arabinofuranosidase 1-like isoform X2 [Lolium perenne]